MPPLHIETPLIESLPLRRSRSQRVWLKLEALQPSGSFKLRGVGHACQRHYARGCRRFVCSSGGNAGLAVAYAGRQLGAHVTVVVPHSTKPRARSAIERESAELIVHGQSWQEAHVHALSLLGGDAAYIHPFDDPLLWEGHATMVAELIAAGVHPDAIVLSVGGGGLLAGVALGLVQHGLEHVVLVTSETAGADSFARSVEAGRRVELPSIDSIATSLGAKQIASRAFEVSQELTSCPHVVSDAAAVRACMKFADDHRLIVEPACGAALALLYDDVSVRLRECREVVVIVCGGAGVSYAELAELAVATSAPQAMPARS